MVNIVWNQVLICCLNVFVVNILQLVIFVLFYLYMIIVFEIGVVKVYYVDIFFFFSLGEWFGDFFFVEFKQEFFCLEIQVLLEFFGIKVLVGGGGLVVFYLLQFLFEVVDFWFIQVLFFVEGFFLFFRWFLLVFLNKLFDWDICNGCNLFEFRIIGFF